MPETKVGIKNINLLAVGDHTVLFYKQESEKTNAAFSFIKYSLDNELKCLYIEEAEKQKRVKDQFVKSSIDLKAYLNSGQLIFLTKEEAYGGPSEFKVDDMINLIEEKVKKARKENFKGLSITGELTGIVDFEGGKEEIIKYERKLHERIFNKYPVIALCRYNLNQFDNQIIKAAIELHDYIVWQGELHENPYYINPEGYRQNKVAEYEVKSWLKNINQYQHKESLYKKTINQTQEELDQKREELSASNQQLLAFNEEIMAMNEELESSFRELEDLNNRFEKMIALVSDIENLSTISENQFLSKILKKAVSIVPEADTGSIYTFGEKYVNFVDCIGYDLEKLNENKIENEAFYNQDQEIEIMDIKELKARNKNHMQQNDFDSLKEESLNKIKEIMYLDLELNGIKKAGITLDIRAGSSKKFSHNSKKIFAAFYNIASSFYKLKEYNRLQNNFTREIISATVKMLEMYDLYTRGHSESVAELAVEIAEEMELSQKVIDDIYWAGLVHDLGKMLIPLEILNKKGKLTDSEYEVIKEHPVLGSSVLSDSNSLKHIAKHVRHHHERWDGEGYPDGLETQQIPLESQIICAADAWDAMRSKRTYREPLSFNHALAEIKDNKGKQFAPAPAEALINVLES
ncbi:MAG: MEDS domain-containing protein [Halanaerobium sp.]